MRKTSTRSDSGNKPTLVREWSLEDAIRVNNLHTKAQQEYVAWIDLMGAKNWMAGSIRRAAEMTGLIHIAGLRAIRYRNVKAYPVIDGVYLVGKNKSDFKSATKSAMRTLAATFLDRKPDRRFLVRGGIAYGRVLHGVDVAKLHNDLKNNKAYSSCLAIGISIGQAYLAESKSPPFGYYVDMTARSTASVDEYPYHSSFHRWWSMTRERQAANEFGVTLDAHFEYLRSKHRELEYPLDRLQEHRLLAREYFHVTDEDIARRQNALRGDDKELAHTLHKAEAIFKKWAIHRANLENSGADIRATDRLQLDLKTRDLLMELRTVGKPLLAVALHFGIDAGVLEAICNETETQRFFFGQDRGGAADRRQLAHTFVELSGCLQYDPKHHLSPDTAG